MYNTYTAPGQPVLWPQQPSHHLALCPRQILHQLTTTEGQLAPAAINSV